MVVYLENDHLVQIDNQKNERQYAVVDTEFGKRFGQGSDEGEAMSIRNITGNVKGGCEARGGAADNKEACKAHLV